MKEDKLVLNNLSKKENYFISLLPLLNMAHKLLTRKNSGKKPFSHNFHFDLKIHLIEESYEQITSYISNKKGEVNLSILNEISLDLISATSEIKIESLVNDFKYLSNQINETVKIIEKM